MRSIVIVFAACVLSACSVIAPKAGPTIAKGVTKYCETVSPAERALIRETVNAQIAPRSIVVDCADSQ